MNADERRFRIFPERALDLIPGLELHALASGYILLKRYTSADGGFRGESGQVLSFRPPGRHVCCSG